MNTPRDAFILLRTYFKVFAAIWAVLAVLSLALLGSWLLFALFCALTALCLWAALTDSPLLRQLADKHLPR